MSRTNQGRRHTEGTAPHFEPYGMLGEGTQERPPFDELLVTDTALLGDTEREVQERIAELGERGVQVRVVDGRQKPAT